MRMPDLKYRYLDLRNPNSEEKYRDQKPASWQSCVSRMYEL